MIFRNRVPCILGAAALLATAIGAGAGMFGSATRVETLIITGNFAKSRLLAELLQHQTKQPVLLVSMRGGGAPELFFMPRGPDAIPVEEAKLLEFLEFLKPSRLVFLGDRSYLPPAYYELLKSKYPALIVSSDDWHRNAEAMAPIFGLRSLPQLYAKCLAELESTPAASATGTSAAPLSQGTPTVVSPDAGR